jgi:phosphodiesterase/alkaline phosphatase D-like protein
MLSRSLSHTLFVATILTTLAPAAQAAVVFDGVAAGNASSADAILWTRADNGGSTTSLTAQVAADPGFDVNTTGSYHNKTPAFQTVEKSYLDYHPTRESILGTPAGGYTLSGPQVNAPSDPRSNGTPQLYFAQQWGANSIYIQTDDRSYRDIRLWTLSGNTTVDDLGPRANNPNRTMLGSTQLQWLEKYLIAGSEGRDRVEIRGDPRFAEMFRQEDPNASTAPSPVDFFSPDTFTT